MGGFLCVSVVYTLFVIFSSLKLLSKFEVVALSKCKLILSSCREMKLYI